MRWFTSLAVGAAFLGACNSDQSSTAPDLATGSTKIAVVTTLNYTGPGSLYDALTGTAPKIVFADNLCSAPCALANGGGYYTVNRNVTILGPDGYQLSAAHFNVGSVIAAISNLRITGTFQALGGGILNEGTLILSNVTVSGKGAPQAYYGGGIYNQGTLTLSQSTVTGNFAYLYGGGIFNAGTLTLSQSTVTGNRAQASGGGIFSAGTLTLTNQSSVCGNQNGDITGGSFTGTNNCQ